MSLPRRHCTARAPNSFASSASLAEQAIARDLEEQPDDHPESPIGDESPEETDSDDSTIRPGGPGTSMNLSMVESYRNPSAIGAGPRTLAVAAAPGRSRNPTRAERHEARGEERSLLRDNHIIPPQHSVKIETFRHWFGCKLSSVMPRGERKDPPAVDGDPIDSGRDGRGQPDMEETAPLLGNANSPHGAQDSPANIDKQWEEAVLSGDIKTTWQRETKVLVRYSSPLILTFVLQYSLNVAGIFTVGHIGKIELGAVSLASMTANITGYAVYQGLATSLDTLCAQAYGSGHKTLVGLQTQRMVYFLCCITIPIGIVWLNAEGILMKVVPEPQIAVLAGRYLKIILIGAPGYACFESGKRFLQAQGLFSASLYVLLICAPLNVFLNWLFVWRFGWGFIGAPIAMTATQLLLPILLILYVRFVAGRGCWPGFTKRALHGWGPMIRLALPGLLMIEAECMAFEILTLASSYLGTTNLAAQTVLVTITSLTYQIPFPLSIAASTRIANLIGATLADAAKTTAKVAAMAAIVVGISNAILLSLLRTHVPQLFTKDLEVIALVANVLPICAAFQLFDALVASFNGVLRGLGFQEFGGYVQVFGYYVVAMPISIGTAFGLGWGLYGLWMGVALALGLILGIEAYFLYTTNWEKSVEDAKRRNTPS